MNIKKAKKDYVRPNVEIVAFDETDIITTSGENMDGEGGWDENQHA